MTLTTPPDARAEKRSLLSLLIPVVVFFFFFWFAEKPLTALLLTLPALLGSLVWYRWIHSRTVKDPSSATGWLGGAALCSIIALCVVHLFYKFWDWETPGSPGSFFGPDVLKWLPMIVLTVVLGLILWFVNHLIRDNCDSDSQSRWTRVADGVRAAPAEAMLTTFILFLVITYLLAYAIAFDDRGGRNPAESTLQGKYDLCPPNEDSPARHGASTSASPPISFLPFRLVSPASADASGSPLPKLTDCALKREPVVIEFPVDSSSVELEQRLAHGGTDGICSNRNLIRRWRQQLDITRVETERRSLENTLRWCELFDRVRSVIETCQLHVMLRIKSIPTRSGDQAHNYKLATDRIAEMAVLLDHEVEALSINEVTRKEWVSVSPLRPQIGGDELNVPRIEIYASIDETPFIPVVMARIQGDLEDVLELLEGMDMKEPDKDMDAIMSGLEVLRDELRQGLHSLHSQQHAADATTHEPILVAGATGGEPAESPATRDTPVYRPEQSRGTPSLEGETNECTRNERPLMDYLYFMIYTTTTTGYGDLRPASPFAKFVVSVANLIEVFFVVIFFNLVIGALRPKQTVPSEQAPGSAGTSDK